MMAFYAKGHLHICAPLIPGLPSPNKANAAQIGKVSTPGTRNRSRSTVDPLDGLPRDMRVNPNFLVPHK